MMQVNMMQIDVIVLRRKMSEKVDEGSRQNKKLEGRYLPLYLAKILIEGRYHGLLEDQTDQIGGRNYGHRILIRLPV